MHIFAAGRGILTPLFMPRMFRQTRPPPPRLCAREEFTERGKTCIHAIDWRQRVNFINEYTQNGMKATARLYVQVRQRHDLPGHDVPRHRGEEFLCTHLQTAIADKSELKYVKMLLER